MNHCATLVLENFVFKKETKFYQRRASKILSLIVSLFTSLYVECFPHEEMRFTPSFKSRIICCPSMEVLQAYLAWRQRECHSKNQYNTCFWMLVKSGKSETEAYNILKVICFFIFFFSLDLIFYRVNYKNRPLCMSLIANCVLCLQ
ncbi:putative tRNA(His) guanylyltransferase [Helianthus annuus]|nr:putative tRNA(His) guanylyltransferase [Helianthus annuus]